MIELLLEFQNNDICDLISNIITEHLSNDENMAINNNILSLNYNDNNDKLVDFISLTLYKLFANDYNNKNLNTWITDEYFFIKSSEIEEIIYKIKNKFSLINTNKTEIDNLLNTLKNDDFYNSLKSLITTTNIINIKGLITFRYKAFTNSYEDLLLTPIISNFMIDKEYKEFMKLLKYFVDISDEFYDEVTIKFLENGEKLVVDENNKNLIEVFSSECINNDLINENVSINDILISGLVSKVPKLIKLYNINNLNEDDTQFVNSLQTLFNVEIVVS